MEKTILLAGGSGLIGSRLSVLLQEQKYKVRLLTRNPRKAGEFQWDPMHGEIDDKALENVDHIISLAGAGIADKRWTVDRKHEIIQSRVRAAQMISEACIRTGTKPKSYIAAAAVGFYGNSGEQPMSESDGPVDEGFLVDCCRKWEQSADGMAALGIRTVKFRIGVVLAKEGGALAAIAKPIRWGLGTYFEDGQAWWSWIHRDDVCRMMLWAIEAPEIEGVFNAVAPNPVRGLALVRSTAVAMQKRVVLLPAPGFALRLMLGEMSAVVLNSNLVLSQKIETAGYQFKYPTLAGALAAIFDKNTKS